MKSIKLLLASVCLFFSITTDAQNSLEKKWSGETYLLVSAYRLGSYQKERPTFFIEQNINYQWNKRFSFGAGTGIDFYPALLGFPLKVDGRYHFNVKSTPLSVVQSYGRYIRLSDIFFNSNRYVGELRVHLNLGNTTLLPRVGYNYLWDQYEGRSLSFFVGIGIEY
ncbi:MAG: hypothetical protein AB8B56_21975 [Crocinitomicaceae bacterium]